MLKSIVGSFADQPVSSFADGPSALLPINRQPGVAAAWVATACCRSVSWWQRRPEEAAARRGGGGGVPEEAAARPGEGGGVQGRWLLTKKSIRLRVDNDCSLRDDVS
jgi:hypothetical protein